MDRELALSLLRRRRPQLEARGVAHVSLFGSVARGGAGEGSDVDVIVTMRPGARLDLIDAGGVQSLLEDVFKGRAVDLVVAPAAGDLAEAINRDRVDAF